MNAERKGGGRRSQVALARNRLGQAIVLIARLVALVIVVAIVLLVLDANPENAIVELITDVGQFLVGPFERLFELRDNDAQVAVNYGIAALVYLAVGQIVGGLLRR